ncbi:MAG: hypothetical protein M3041_00285 [Acidobacteriota bacterium]|nr:hypothetical protein [Acidobacteriota bacterium]
MSVGWFVSGWGVGFAAYVIVQIAAILTLRNRWRLISAIPVPFMVYIFIITVKGEHAGSNLWPLMMILFSPGAALGVLLVWVGALVTTNRDVYLWVPAATVVGLFLLAAVSSEGVAVLWTGEFTLIPAAACFLVAAALDIYFRVRDRSTRAV